MKKPPAHLSPEARRWWRKVVAGYALADGAEQLLRLACEQWDLAQKARRAVAKHGLTCRDRHGQVKARPEIGIFRNASAAFASLVRQLGFKDEDPEDA